MQRCPLCDRNNRVVVKGVYLNEGKHELYPDMGYSFCNCHDLFYTRKENLVDPFSYEPIDGVITAPDIFFVEWGNDPYLYPHWNPRKYEILWDMNSLVAYLMKQGYRITSAIRDFDVASKTPQHFHITVRK